MTSREEDVGDFDVTPSAPPQNPASSASELVENGAQPSDMAKATLPPSSSASSASSIPIGGARRKVRSGGPRLPASSPPEVPNSLSRFHPDLEPVPSAERLPMLAFERQDSEDADATDDYPAPALNSYLSSEPLAADLPRSFYALDIGSDSEAGSVNNSYFHPPQGVSGAGQSNLSTEIAALIQSEMASKPSQETASLRRDNSSPDAADFLEMDFEGDNSDSEDSGQGGTETNSLQEQFAAAGASEAGVGAVPRALTEPEWIRRRDSRISPTSHQPVPDENGSRPEEVSRRVGRGTTSVPAVTPVREEPLASFMVRSRSLNSQIVHRPMAANCEVLSYSSRCCLNSESKPARNEPFSINMEMCGAKLSQREQFIFGTHCQHSEAAELGNNEVQVDKSMVWSETEAFGRQVSQIGASACGATAVINVFLALGLPHSVQEVNSLVRTRIRKEGAGLPDYLFSRALAGATHRDLIRGVRLGSDGKVISRFFHMFPPRKVALSAWLSSWIKKGAVPIATLNRQKCVRLGQTIPDAWHHQMVFGVGPSGVYLTNPLERVSESVIIEQLSSPSVLLVRRNDVTQRYTSDCDLSTLATHSNPAWDWFNVLGQVVNVLREHGSFAQANCQRELTQHIKIPASYKSGVTLCVLSSNPAAEELMACPELEPVIDGDNSVKAQCANSPS